MDDIVLYVKSYHRDVERVKVLFETIKSFNRDGIKFYVSAPAADKPLFQNVLGTSDYTLVNDEATTTFNSGWIGQQIVKVKFWKMGFCKNYVVLDSDCQFIRDFYKSDFLYEGDIPYTICNECKRFFEFMYKHPLSFDPRESYEKDRRAIMDVLGRTGVLYDFGNSPFIWSAKVWENLEKEYLTPNNLTFEDLLQGVPSELTWYGEWLLASKVVPLYPREPIFRSFGFKHEYEKEKAEGMTAEILAKLYLGYVMPSSWGAPLKF